MGPSPHSHFHSIHTGSMALLAPSSLLSSPVHSEPRCAWLLRNMKILCMTSLPRRPGWSFIHSESSRRSFSANAFGTLAHPGPESQIADPGRSSRYAICRQILFKGKVMVYCGHSTRSAARTIRAYSVPSAACGHLHWTVPWEGIL